MNANEREYMLVSMRESGSFFMEASIYSAQADYTARAAVLLIPRREGQG